MRNIRRNRQGAVLAIVGLIIIVLLGMVALAVDIGIITMTDAQLESASDSGSLAGGTELLSGLGISAFRTPEEVKSRAENQAVAYVAKHPAGEADSLFIDPSRDVRLGQASFDEVAGTWNFTWGATPYNAVQVKTLRASEGTTPGDRPLPLIFAQKLGQDFANVRADSVAVILPASGIQILPGANYNSALSPFVLARRLWEKRNRAQAYYDANNLTSSDLSEANNGHLIPDPEDLDELGEPNPLFYEKGTIGQSNNITYTQLFEDSYGVIDPDRHDAANITNSPDGVLEINIYPRDTAAGNFGTVDIGGSDNSTSDLSRQIETGVSEADLAEFENNAIDPEPDSPIVLTGDTGISSGIDSALDSVVGQCRTVLLFDDYANPGNTAEFTVTEMVGVRFMYADLQTQNKVLAVQPCSVSDPAGIPDFNADIGDNTSFFTPLILAE